MNRCVYHALHWALLVGLIYLGGFASKSYCGDQATNDDSSGVGGESDLYQYADDLALGVPLFFKSAQPPADLLPAPVEPANSSHLLKSNSTIQSEPIHVFGSFDGSEDRQYLRFFMNDRPS